jgi:hypothetical protein
MIKTPPPLHVLTAGVLGCVATFGLCSVTVGLSTWVRGHDASLLNQMLSAAGFVLVPVLAILDLILGRPAGKYAASLSLLCAMAMTLRIFGIVVTAPHSMNSGPVAMFLLASTFLLGALLIMVNTTRPLPGHDDEATGYLPHPSAPDTFASTACDHYISVTDATHDRHALTGSARRDEVSST